jgi:hypothetical protein
LFDNTILDEINNKKFLKNKLSFPQNINNWNNKNSLNKIPLDKSPTFSPSRNTSNKSSTIFNFTDIPSVNVLKGFDTDYHDKVLRSMNDIMYKIDIITRRIQNDIFNNRAWTDEELSWSVMSFFFFFF